MIPFNYTKDALGPLLEMPEELIQKCRSLPGYNISALAGLLFYIPQLEEAKTILEIGTGWCLSTIAFACAARINNGRVLSIDIHDRENLLSQYPSLRSYITQVNINSHRTNDTAKLLKQQNFESVDVLFIDGDHTHPGVKQDFDFYTQYLSEEGIVILHDIALVDVGKGIDSVEVFKFWEEIDTTKFDKFSIYASNGLGLVRKKR